MCMEGRLASRDSQWEGCDRDEDEGQPAAGIWVVIQAMDE